MGGERLPGLGHRVDEWQLHLDGALEPHDDLLLIGLCDAGVVADDLVSSTNPAAARRAASRQAAKCGAPATARVTGAPFVQVRCLRFKRCTHRVAVHDPL